MVTVLLSPKALTILGIWLAVIIAITDIKAIKYPVSDSVKPKEFGKYMGKVTKPTKTTS